VLLQENVAGNITAIKMGKNNFFMAFVLIKNSPVEQTKK
jgi:hypothetical protein